MLLAKLAHPAGLVKPRQREYAKTAQMLGAVAATSGARLFVSAMWLFTDFGFFSIVEKPSDRGKGTLTIRARAREDLEVLATRMPALGSIKAGGGSDYPYRATAPRADVAVALASLAAQLDYSNFKDAVAARHSKVRAHDYHKVWSAMLMLENSTTKRNSTKVTVPMAGTERSKREAYGGVLIDSEGRVLLREPSNHFDGYVWTFPKGRPDPGESPQAAALREVREESGCVARIRHSIPGEFAGGTTRTTYFLMEPVETGLAIDPAETTAVIWVTPEKARTLLEQSTNVKGRNRDLAVLAAALAEHERLTREPS